MRATILLSLGLALAASCTKATTAREQPDTRLIRYAANNDLEPALIEVRGVQVSIAQPVSNALSVESSATGTMIFINMTALPPPTPDEDPACRFWLRGRPIFVRDGHLHVGDHDFGAVAKGDSVAVDAAGVHVGGELRGALEK